MLPLAGQSGSMHALQTAQLRLSRSPPESHLPPPLLRRGAPVEAIAILVLLATLVGIYSLPGVAIVCAVVPLQ